MTGENRGSRLTQAVCSALSLVAAPCAAQGSGPPAGARDVVVGLWGVLGLLSAVALLIAFARERRYPNSRLAGALVWMVLLYSLSAFACFFLVSATSKFTGTIGLILLALVAHRLFRGFSGWRGVSNALLGTALVALLLVPNDYWKVRWLTLTRIVYVENLEGLETFRVLRERSPGGGRLALEDGTLFIQTRYVRARRSAGDGRRVPNVGFSELVVLEPISSPEPGRWYEIEHYQRRYVPGAHHDGQRARHVLGLAQERVDVWQRVTRTLGFLVDDAAPVSAEDIIIDMLKEEGGSWSDGGDQAGNRYFWAKTLLARGRADLSSTRFLDRAFQQGSNPYGLIMLLRLGMSPVAQDSRGNTVLHFAAAQCDPDLLDALLDGAMDPSIRNRRGQTALDVVRMKAATSPLSRCMAVQRGLEERTPRPTTSPAPPRVPQASVPGRPAPERRRPSSSGRRLARA
jgi:hypothetical protein